MSLNQKLFNSGGATPIVEQISVSLQSAGCNNQQSRVGLSMHYDFTAVAPTTQAKIEVYYSTSSDMSANYTLLWSTTVSTGSALVYGINVYGCTQACWPSPYCPNFWFRLKVSDANNLSDFYLGSIQHNF